MLFKQLIPTIGMEKTEIDKAIMLAEDLLQSIPSNASEVTPTIHSKALEKARKLKSIRL